MLLKNRYIQRLVGGGITERVGIRLASSLEYLLLSGHKDRSELRRIWARTLGTANAGYFQRSLSR